MGELLRMPERKRRTPRTASVIADEADDARESADYYLTVTFLALLAAKEAYREACAASRRHRRLRKRYWTLTRGLPACDVRPVWHSFEQKAIEGNRPVLAALRRWRGGGTGPAWRTIEDLRSRLAEDA